MIPSPPSSLVASSLASLIVPWPFAFACSVLNYSSDSEESEESEEVIVSEVFGTIPSESRRNVSKIVIEECHVQKNIIYAFLPNSVSTDAEFDILPYFGELSGMICNLKVLDDNFNKSGYSFELNDEGKRRFEEVERVLSMSVGNTFKYYQFNDDI